MYFDRAEEQMKEVRNMEDILDTIQDKLNDLQNNSRHSLDNSQAALDMNIRNTDLITTIKVKKNHVLTSFIKKSSLYRMKNYLFILLRILFLCRKHIDIWTGGKR